MTVLPENTSSVYIATGTGLFVVLLLPNSPWKL